MGILKSNSDIRYLKEAASLAVSLCNELLAEACPGQSTVEIEQKANRLLSKHRSSAPFKAFDGFGQATCISLNEEVVNGPPSRERILKAGDLVSIAIGTEVRGLYGKAARTRYLGSSVPPEVQRLLEGTQAVFPALLQAMPQAKTLNELLAVIPAVAKQYDLRVIKGTSGSAIGKKLHENPPIPNSPEELTETIPLLPGMALNIMPMMTLGESDTWELHEDGWTHVTQDKALSAHFADSFLVIEGGGLLQLA